MFFLDFSRTTRAKTQLPAHSAIGLTTNQRVKPSDEDQPQLAKPLKRLHTRRKAQACRPFEETTLTRIRRAAPRRSRSHANPDSVKLNGLICASQQRPADLGRTATDKRPAATAVYRVQSRIPTSPHLIRVRYDGKRKKKKRTNQTRARPQ